MSGQDKKHRGFIVMELFVGLSILGVLLVGFSFALDGFAKLNHYQMVRQRCIAAARAQLDSIAVTGRPISDRDFERLWPKLTVSLKKSDGIGQWEAATLVLVTASGKSGRREVKVQLARYILGPAEGRKAILVTPAREEH